MTDRIEDGGPAEAGLVAWLEGAATYFEKRPTNGEDRAHWANVFNAENCRKAAAEITRLRAEVERKDAALEPFARHLNEMKFDLDYEGNELPDGAAVGWVYVTNGDFRRAHSALSNATTPETGGAA